MIADLATLDIVSRCTDFSSPSLKSFIYYRPRLTGSLVFLFGTASFVALWCIYRPQYREA